MSFSAPDAPDPTATANTQQQYNTSAAQTQNKTNSYNQTGVGGSMTYVADPNSPSGYSLQTSAGAYGTPLIGAAANLANNSAGMYSQPTDLSAATGQTANLLNSWQQQYLQPIFNQQQSNTDAQLRNQGLAPGTEAYNNAQNLLSRNQANTTNQYLSQNEAQAYGQALQNYQLPLQTIGGLVQTGSPTGFQQTPTSQVQPANYQGAVQSNYQNELQNYQNTWNNVGKLGVAAAGLAAAPFTGGLSLGAAGALGGMFGGGGQSGSGGVTGAYNYGGTAVPQIGGGWG